MTEEIATPMRPVKVTNAQARIRAQATEKQFRFGHFNLPPGKVVLTSIQLCNVLRPYLTLRRMNLRQIMVMER
jgi:hypothetical protein